MGIAQQRFFVWAVRGVSLLAIVLAIGGCAATKTQRSQADTTIEFQVRLFTDLALETPSSLPAGTKVLFELPLIARSFVGSPDKRIGLEYQTGAGAQLAIAKLMIEDKAQQALMEATPKATELDVVPAKVRYGRFGSFGVVDLSVEGELAWSPGETGFKDLSTGEYLWLAYFSGPVSVRGKQPLGTHPALEVAIDVPVAGVYWLAVGTGPEDDQPVRVVEPQQPVLAIKASR